MRKRHLVLAGDSIFDNDEYIPGEAGVIAQLRTTLPDGCTATKIAVDGHCVRHIYEQISALPDGATDLVVSVGGNDALTHSSLLEKVMHPDDLAGLLTEPLAGFRAEYRGMLDAVLRTGLKPFVCTIYTDIPFKDPIWRQFVPIALDAFNAIIREEAQGRKIEVLPLHQVCTEPGDFADFSPIEPSNQGGQKIVDHIVDRVLRT